MNEALKGYPVVIAETVRWGDMDAFDHVNNTVYFRYFESARIAYFERVGFVRRPGLDETGPILGATSCRFRRPLRYPDRILVGARVTELKDDRMEMAYLVWSEGQNAVAAEGTATVVSYDYAHHTKVVVPKQVRDAVEALG